MLVIWQFVSLYLDTVYAIGLFPSNYDSLIYGFVAAKLFCAKLFCSKVVTWFMWDIA